MRSKKTLFERLLAPRQIEKLPFDYTVKRTQRKSLGIYVFRHGKVEVRVPHVASERDITDFVVNNVDWVLERLGALPDVQQQETVAVYGDGAQHYFLGEVMYLTLPVSISGSTVKAALKDQKLLIPYHEPAYGEQDVQAWLEKHTIHWYRQQAKLHFPARLSLCLSTMQRNGVAINVDIPPLAIRRMKTRWGSCSSRGNVNLNLWLIRLPLPLQDYVITHELCHLIELNHSRRFYALMDRVMPDWQQRKQSLALHPGACLAHL